MTISTNLGKKLTPDRLLLVHLGRDGRLEGGAVAQRRLSVDRLLPILGHDLLDDLAVAFHQPPTAWQEMCAFNENIILLKLPINS